MSIRYAPIYAPINRCQKMSSFKSQKMEFSDFQCISRSFFTISSENLTKFTAASFFCFQITFAFIFLLHN